MNQRLFSSCHLLLGGAALAVGMQFVVNEAEANPTGMTVASGSATSHGSGNTLTVNTTTPGAVLNWQSFNIGPSETTTFQMPSPGSYVVNQIHDANPSQIYGHLNANGLVILLNQNGFYFGPNAFIATGGGLVVSTAHCAPPENTGGSWEFNGPPPLASIVNYGSIQTSPGKSIYLIADQVQNHGNIEAPGGSVGLVAGQTVMLTERPDGRGMSMNVTLPQGSVANDGSLKADAGTLALNAQVVNQDGVLQANAFREVNGQIELVASDTVNLGANSTISATGDTATPGSAGGEVKVQAGKTFSDAVGSQINAAGQSSGGAGGSVEISAPNVASLNTAVNAGTGTFLLDPVNITLGTSGSTSGGSTGTVDGSTGTGTLTVNINTAFKNITAGNILLEASGNITLNPNVKWDLSQTVPSSLTTGQLTLEAHGNIVFGNGSLITDENNWSISLLAGYNFTTHAVTAGLGNIYLNGSNGGTGSGSLATTGGNVLLEAGSAIQLGNGTVTSQTGSITTESGADTLINGSGSLSTAGNGNISMVAGCSSFNAVAANATVGKSANLYLNGGNGGTGSGSLTTAGGNILLEAGNAIQVGTGTVSTQGGSITAEAGGDLTLTGADSSGSPVFSTTDQGNLTLAAGYSFTQQGVVAGTGNLYLNGGNGLDQPVSLQTASGNINLTAGNALQLGLGSITTSGGSITAQAGGDFTFEDGASTISTANGGNITLQAGYTALGGYTFISSGNLGTSVGSLFIGGPGNPTDPTQALKGGVVTTDFGNITLGAANAIQLGSGSVTTTAGGSISATAVFGDLNTGSTIDPTLATGYQYNQQGNASSLAGAYNATAITGLGTLAGGDVTLQAGQNVTSYLPSSGGPIASFTAGAGAFSHTIPGKVTVIAGGDVTGNFVEGDGAGAIYAGVTMNASGTPQMSGSHYQLNSPVVGGNAGSAGNSATAPNLALTLASGGWSVAAAQNIDLQEVRNPNGDFDGTAGSAYVHKFDYSDNGYLNLSAGNQVVLGGNSLPRNATGGSDHFTAVPVLYPPILNLYSGAGGVQLGVAGANANSLDTKVTLFPSAQGELTVNTSGSLTSGLGKSLPAYLIVSGSANRQYNNTANFGVSDFASSPIHLNSPTPVSLTVGGNMQLINLISPESAQINVNGNLVDSSLQAMNLSLAAGFKADEAQANADDAQISVTPAITSVTVAGDLLESYKVSVGSAPTPVNSLGYTIGGGGELDLTARTIDLGDSKGVASVGASGSAFTSLIPLYADNGPFTTGANINITTTGNHTQAKAANGDLSGDLDIPFSSVSTVFGGDIKLNIGNLAAYQTGAAALGSTKIGGLNIGSSINVPNASTPYGVYTSGGGDVTAITTGDINVYAGGLGTYNGGNVTALSLNGNINVGASVSQQVEITAYWAQRGANHSVTVPSASTFYIALTGVYALTTPTKSAGANGWGGSIPTLGNIILEAPNGEVATESVVQDSFNDTKYPNANVTILAGYEVIGANQPVTTEALTLPLNAGNISWQDAYKLRSVNSPVDPYISADLVAPGGQIVGELVRVSEQPANYVKGNQVPSRNLLAAGAGILALNLTENATGEVLGQDVSLGGLNVTAQQTVDVTAVGAGNVNVSSTSGTVSGTIIGVGSVSVSGASVTADLISANVSGTTSGQSGLGSGNAAAGASTAAAGDASSKAATAATTLDNGGDNDTNKKKGKGIALARKVSRVTVLLPSKN